MPENKQRKRPRCLRNGGFLTDTPPEQPIPEWWGGASIALRTLRAPIGQTASVARQIGRSCLTGYRRAAGPSLRLSAGGLDVAELLGYPRPDWAAPQDSGDAPCTTLINPQPDDFKCQGERPQILSALRNLSPNLKEACVSSASGTTSPFTHRNTEFPGAVTLKYLE